jgi:hypothetical protein
VILHKKMAAIQSWSVADVEAFLVALELGHLAPAFRDSGVTGADLLKFGNKGVQPGMNVSWGL